MTRRGGERSLWRSDGAGDDSKVALLSLDASHPEEEQTDGGGRKELGGLVGWRRWGSPTGVNTQGKTQIGEKWLD